MEIGSLGDGTGDEELGDRGLGAKGFGPGILRNGILGDLEAKGKELGYQGLKRG